MAGLRKIPKWWKPSKAPLSGEKPSDNGGSASASRRSRGAEARPEASRGRAARAARQGHAARREPGRVPVEGRRLPRAARAARPLPAGQPPWLRAAVAAEIAAQRQRVEHAAPAGRALLALDADTRAMLASAATRGGAAPGGERRSAERYRRVVAVDCAAQRLPWEQATRDGYQLRRSAWQALLLDRAAGLRREAEAARKVGQRGEWVKLLRDAWEHAATAQALLAAGQRAEHQPGGRSLRRKHTPPDADTVLAHLALSQQPRAQRYALSAAVVMLFGVRPAELTGLVLETHGTTLRATVRGAKVDAQRGQALRVLELPAGAGVCRAARWAASVVDDAGGRMVLAGGDALVRGLRRALTRVAPGLCPYVFRHAMASRLKAAGVPPAAAAATMGHASTRSIARYGRARHGGGGVAPRCVGATRSPRRVGNLTRPTPCRRAGAAQQREVRVAWPRPKLGPPRSTPRLRR